MEKNSVECGGCGSVLKEPANTPIQERKPCPECGSPKRNFYKALTTKPTVQASLMGKLRNPEGKIKIKLKSFNDFSRRLHKFVSRYYLVNKRDNIYEEKYTDPDSGEVLYQNSEPLTDHRGHGSASKSKKEGG